MPLKHTGALKGVRVGHGAERAHDFCDQGGGQRSVPPSAPRRPPHEHGAANPGPQHRRVK